jgi:hypothetical protein
MVVHAILATHRAASGEGEWALRDRPVGTVLSGPSAVIAGGVDQHDSYTKLVLEKSANQTFGSKGSVTLLWLLQDAERERLDDHEPDLAGPRTARPPGQGPTTMASARAATCLRRNGGARLACSAVARCTGLELGLASHGGANDGDAH